MGFVSSASHNCYGPNLCEVLPIHNKCSGIDTLRLLTEFAIRFAQGSQTPADAFAGQGEGRKQTVGEVPWGWQIMGICEPNEILDCFVVHIGRRLWLIFLDYEFCNAVTRLRQDYSDSSKNSIWDCLPDTT